MACLALTVGGTVLGNLLLPGIGSALGSYVGGLVDQQLFGPERETRTVTGPRLQDLRMQSSAYGSGTLFEGITVEQRELRTDPDGLTRFYAEPANHRGELFQVAGALNVAPSRQGRPLIAQAGGSGTGIKVAAKYAEMVFTNASDFEGAAAYRANLDKALIEAGRTPGTVPAIPGLIPYLGRTTKDAEDLVRELDQYVYWDLIAPFALGQFGIAKFLDVFHSAAPWLKAASPISANSLRVFSASTGSNLASA